MYRAYTQPRRSTAPDLSGPDLSGMTENQRIDALERIARDEEERMMTDAARESNKRKWLRANPHAREALVDHYFP